MAFAARYAGTCNKCGKPITPGQLIHWNRKVKGEPGKSNTWHSNCASPDDRSSVLAGGIAGALASGIITVATPDLEPFAGVEFAPEPPKAERAVIARELAAEREKHAADMREMRERVELLASRLGHDSTPCVPELAKITPSSPWYDTLAAILPVCSRILLIGPPGTGKSTTAAKVANCKHRLTMTETTSEEKLLGMFQLVDGSTKWVDGPVTAAMRYGEPILVDEIDRYSPEAQSLLYGIIDDAPHVQLANGESVSAAPGYKMIMTSNEGLDTLTPAVQDRIEVIIHAGTPHKAATIELPRALAYVCENHYKSQPIAPVKLPPTLRRMKVFNKLRTAGASASVAANLVFGHDAGPEILSVIASAESR